MLAAKMRELCHVFLWHDVTSKSPMDSHPAPMKPLLLPRIAASWETWETSFQLYAWEKYKKRDKNPATSLPRLPRAGIPTGARAPLGEKWEPVGALGVSFEHAEGGRTLLR